MNRGKLFLILLLTGLLKYTSKADTIDYWSIHQGDRCLILATHNGFGQKNEVIYIRNEDRKNTYSLSYMRDVGYVARKKLHFYCKGIEFYSVDYGEQTGNRAVEFELEDVLNNLAVLDSGTVIKIYYSEQNEYFLDDEMYVGSLVASERITGRGEENYSVWLVAGVFTIGFILLLIVQVRKKKQV